MHSGTYSEYKGPLLAVHRSIPSPAWMGDEQGDVSFFDDSFGLRPWGHARENRFLVMTRQMLSPKHIRDLWKALERKFARIIGMTRPVKARDDWHF